MCYAAFLGCFHRLHLLQIYSLLLIKPDTVSCAGWEENLTTKPEENLTK